MIKKLKIIVAKVLSCASIYFFAVVKANFFRSTSHCFLLIRGWRFIAAAILNKTIMVQTNKMKNKCLCSVCSVYQWLQV